MISKEQEKILTDKRKEIEEDWIEFSKKMYRNFPELKEMMEKRISDGHELENYNKKNDSE